jgi:hypothetical protein
MESGVRENIERPTSNIEGRICRTVGVRHPTFLVAGGRSDGLSPLVSGKGRYRTAFYRLLSPFIAFYRFAAKSFFAGEATIGTQGTAGTRTVRFRSVSLGLERLKKFCSREERGRSFPERTHAGNRLCAPISVGESATDTGGSLVLPGKIELGGKRSRGHGFAVNRRDVVSGRDADPFHIGRRVGDRHRRVACATQEDRIGREEG